MKAEYKRKETILDWNRINPLLCFVFFHRIYFNQQLKQSAAASAFYISLRPDSTCVWSLFLQRIDIEPLSNSMCLSNGFVGLKYGECCWKNYPWNCGDFSILQNSVYFKSRHNFTLLNRNRDRFNKTEHVISFWNILADMIFDKVINTILTNLIMPLNDDQSQYKSFILTWMRETKME